jgi:hypothetical protein
MNSMDVCPSCAAPLTRIHDHHGTPTRETVCMACAAKAKVNLTALAQPPGDVPTEEAPARKGKRDRDQKPAEQG